MSDGIMSDESDIADIDLGGLLMLLHNNFYCEVWASEQLGLSIKKFNGLLDEWGIKPKELKRRQYIVFSRNNENYCTLTIERNTFSTKQKTYTVHDLLANWLNSKTGERVYNRQAINSFVNDRSIRKRKETNRYPINFSEPAYERLLAENNAICKRYNSK